MDRLPGELIVHLCSVLPVTELKAFRLCCKQFAILGEASLFESFEFRLWPSTNRLAAFEQLAGSPSIASKLQKLSLATGVQLEYADYRYWQAQIYKELSGRWSQSYSGRSPSREEYNDFHSNLQARFTEQTRTDYELYRHYLDDEADLFAKQLPSRLHKALDELYRHTPRLKYQITMSEPQITLDEVESFRPPDGLSIQAGLKHPRTVVTRRRQSTLDHFIACLSAISQSSLPFSDLTLGNLPVQLMESSQEQARSALGLVFTRVRNMDLSISPFPHSGWLDRRGHAHVWRAPRLRYLLNQATRLECLHLEFCPDTVSEFSSTLFDQRDLDDPAHPFLKGLRTLSISRFECDWPQLRWLLRGTNKLQHLTLAHGRFESGSMLDLVSFTPSLHLKSIQLLGTWAVDDDHGEWHAHTPSDFTDCVNATVYEGPYVDNGLKSNLEAYMLTGSGKCLVAEQASWELLGDTSWHYIPRDPATA